MTQAGERGAEQDFAALRLFDLDVLDGQGLVGCVEDRGFHDWFPSGLWSLGSVDRLGADAKWVGLGTGRTWRARARRDRRGAIHAAVGRRGLPIILFRAGSAVDRGIKALRILRDAIDLARHVG